MTRETYERAPDGKQWAPTLAGLNEAIGDSIMESGANPDTVFRLNVIIDGQSKTFRTFKGGLMSVPGGKK